MFPPIFSRSTNSICLPCTFSNTCSSLPERMNHLINGGAVYPKTDCFEKK
uniref:Uncharacterized protein n=1 Tax=Anguilla anguilla TaxID=7936 RepID=A0A0E9SYJ7_ANGAN